MTLSMYCCIPLYILDVSLSMYLYLLIDCSIHLSFQKSIYTTINSINNNKKTKKEESSSLFIVYCTVPEYCTWYRSID